MDIDNNNDNNMSVEQRIFTLSRLMNFLLANGSNINSKIHDGSTVLHLACKHNNVQFVIYLLNNNADLSIKDNNGWLPLHYATRYAKFHMFDFMFSHTTKKMGKISINTKTKTGEAMLQMACKNHSSSNVDIMEFLIDRGAD